MDQKAFPRDQIDPYNSDPVPLLTSWEASTGSIKQADAWFWLAYPSKQKLRSETAAFHRDKHQARWKVIRAKGETATWRNGYKLAVNRLKQ